MESWTKAPSSSPEWLRLIWKGLKSRGGTEEYCFSLLLQMGRRKVLFLKLRFRVYRVLFVPSCCFKHQGSTILLSEHQKFLLLREPVRFWCFVCERKENTSISPECSWVSAESCFHGVICCVSRMKGWNLWLEMANSYQTIATRIDLDALLSPRVLLQHLHVAISSLQPALCSPLARLSRAAPTSALLPSDQLTALTLPLSAVICLLMGVCSVILHCWTVVSASQIRASYLSEFAWIQLPAPESIQPLNSIVLLLQRVLIGYAEFFTLSWNKLNGLFSRRTALQKCIFQLFHKPHGFSGMHFQLSDSFLICHRQYGAAYCSQVTCFPISRCSWELY